MPEHPHNYEDDAIFNPETHHEETDVSVRALFIFIACFIVFAIITHLVLWGLYKGFVSVEKRRQLGPVTEMQRPADMAVPKNQPLLQPFPRQQTDGVQPPNRSTPVKDLAEMREAEQKALTTYGWVDRQKGIVRVPIDRAMQLTLQRGLPVQGERTPAAQGAHP